MATNEDLLASLVNEQPGPGGNVFYQAAPAPPPPAPQAVKAYQRATPKRPAAERTLLDPAVLERSLPAAKALFAILTWVNSGATMGVTGAQIQLLVWRYHHPDLLETAAPSLLSGFGAGIAVALILTFAQVYTLRYAPRWYWVALFPDAATTALQWCQWLLIPLLVMLLPWPWVAWALAIVLGYIIGVYSAKLPERLVFGRR